MNTHKTCTRCLTAYPRTTEYFYRNSEYLKYGECDGLLPYCKECDDARRLEQRLDNYDRELQRGRTNNKQWRADNPEHVKQYRKDYYIKNGK